MVHLQLLNVIWDSELILLNKFFFWVVLVTMDLASLKWRVPFKVKVWNHIWLSACFVIMFGITIGFARINESPTPWFWQKHALIEKSNSCTLIIFSALEFFNYYQLALEFYHLSILTFSLSSEKSNPLPCESMLVVWLWSKENYLKTRRFCPISKRWLCFVRVG
jgi:hypothetical protein